MPVCTFSDTVPVGPDPAGGIIAPDVTFEDVPSAGSCCITWTPEDGVELLDIVGLPSSVRVSGPNSAGEMNARYFAPSQDETWDYYIVALYKDSKFWHDPKIVNTTPTTRGGRGKKASGKKASSKSAKAKPAPKSARKPAPRPAPKASKKSKSSKGR